MLQITDHVLLHISAINKIIANAFAVQSGVDVYPFTCIWLSAFPGSFRVPSEKDRTPQCGTGGHMVYCGYSFH